MRLTAPYLICVLSAALAAGAERSDVLILRPVLSFADYSTDAPLSADQFGAAAYAAQLRNVAAEQFGHLEMSVADQEAIADPVAREAAGLLEKDTSRLARGILSDETRDTLRRASVAGKTREVLVLVQYMKAKVGSSTSWALHPKLDLNRMTPRMTTLLLQAALISCRTGQVVWQGQAFRRDLPGATSGKFRQFATSQYKDLKNKVR